MDVIQVRPIGEARCTTCGHCFYCQGVIRDLILGDDALLYIAYVMLIWAPLTPATRWSRSQPPADSNDW